MSLHRFPVGRSARLPLVAFVWTLTALVALPGATFGGQGASVVGHISTGPSSTLPDEVAGGVVQRSHANADRSSCANCIVDNLTIGIAPQSPVYDPVYHRMYVLTGGQSPWNTSYNLSMISDANNSVVSVTEVGDAVGAPVVDARTGNLYLIIASLRGLNLTMVSGATDAMMGSVAIPGSPSAPPVCDPTDGDVFLALSTPRAMEVYSGTNNTHLSQIGLPGPVSGLLYNPRSDSIYAAGATSPVIYIISGIRLSVVGTIPLPMIATSMVYDPTSGDVYAVSYGNASSPGQLAVVSALEHSTISRATLGYGSLIPSYDPSNGDVYIDNLNSANVTLVSGWTARPLGSISLFAGYLTPPTYDVDNGNMYQADEGSDGQAPTVIVLPGRSGASISDLPVGFAPVSPTYDPTNGDLYVPSGPSGLEIISGGGSSRLSVEASALPLSGEAILAVGFSAFVTGGTGVYSFSWDFGDGSPRSALQYPTHDYTSPGTYHAIVAVNDSSGNLTTGQEITVVVFTPWQQVASSPYFLAGLLGVVVLAIGLAIFIRRRSRRKRLRRDRSQS